jgi:hypothetical protein
VPRLKRQLLRAGERCARSLTRVPALQVADVIQFDPASGLIKALRAYKG